MQETHRVPNHLLFEILRNRWFLVKALLVIMIPTVVITFLLPKKYTVTTIIMPPEDIAMPALSELNLSETE